MLIDDKVKLASLIILHFIISFFLLNLTLNQFITFDMLEKVKLEKSIAVLPFINLSSDEENEYFSDGITEEIIIALTKIEGLKVIARTSSFSFKGKNIDVRNIAKQLDVHTILEGSVRKYNNHVRITSQLINALDGSLIWSENFDRELKDIFILQDEISLIIADQIRENFGHFEIEDYLVETKDISPENYQLYLRGRYFLHRFNKEDILKAISIFKEVIKSQKNFALAYSSIHYGYNFLAASGLMTRSEALTEGKKYLDKAFELDPELPECHHSLGWHYLNEDWDFIKAERHLSKAISLRPGYADAHQKLFITFILEGKIELAFEHITTAYKLDPLAPLNIYFMAYYYYVSQEFEKSNKYFKKLIALEPSFIAGYSIYGLSLILQKKPDSVLDLANKIPDIPDAKIERKILIALANTNLEKNDDSRSGLEDLYKELEGDHRERILFFLIYIETILGNFEKAFELIDIGISRKEPLLTLLKVDPLLKSLHSFNKWNEIQKVIYALSENHLAEKKNISTLKMDETEIVKAIEQLKLFMSAEAPYLNPSLSLRELANSISLHPNKLSWLINEQMGKNFNEYVNHHRLEKFMSNAKDPENSHLSLLGLAYESGFNSKTVFNAYFKKAMKMTPKTWLNSVK